MSQKIAIVGHGNVGQALAQGLRRAGHEIRFGSREPNEPVKEAVAWGDVVILAVPWGAHKELVNTVGPALNGKTVIDVSNALTPTMELAVGFTTSAAEELQKLLPKARVVKAFNTIFAANMSSGRLSDQPLTVLVAGDDAESREKAKKLAQDIGFDSVDAGPLKHSRYLEPLGMLNILLGYGQKMGTNIGFKLIKGPAA